MSDADLDLADVWHRTLRALDLAEMTPSQRALVGLARLAGVLEHTALITKTVVDLGREKPFPQEEIAKLVDWRKDVGLMRPGQAEDLCAACGVCNLLGATTCRVEEK